MVILNFIESKLNSVIQFFYHLKQTHAVKLAQGDTEIYTD